MIHLDWSYQYWLAAVLAVGGFRVFPARSAGDAHSLIQSYQLMVVLIIADPELSGIEQFVGALRQRQGRVPVIATVEHGAIPCLMDAAAVFERPRTVEECDAAAPIWLSSVQSILR